MKESAPAETLGKLVIVVNPLRLEKRKGQ